MDREIAFEVPGLPPLKNEARSLFSKTRGLSKRGEIVILLERARARLAAVGTPRFQADERLGLEVTIVSRKGPPPGDATNYLGGIADVLEDKGRREKQKPGALEHLGDLRTVSVYPDDSQFRVVRYTHRVGAEDKYIVRVWALPAASR
jgi:hypothetical protein